MLQTGARVVMQWAFEAENSNELDVAQGVELIVLAVAGEWVKVQNPQSNEVGSVPITYVKVVDVPQKKRVPPAVPTSRPSSLARAAASSTPKKSTVPETPTPVPFETTPPKQFQLPPLPPSFVPEVPNDPGYQSSSNPLFLPQSASRLRHNDSSSGNNGGGDDEDLARRFQMLKSRMNSLDQQEEEEEEDILEAIVVEAPALPPPNKPTSSYPNVPSMTMTQQSAYEQAQLARERERAEQQQIMQAKQEALRKEQEFASQRRAAEMKRVAEEQALLREQRIQQELDSAIKSSTVLKPEQKQANYVLLGEDKRKVAITLRNQGKLSECCKENVAAMRYWLQAIKFGQYKFPDDKLELLQRMERMVDEELSVPPLSEFSDPVEVIDLLVGMVNQGYPTMEGLKKSALRFRGEATRLEQEKQVDRAILFYKQAAQRLIVLEKLLRASGKNASSVTEAASEIITHCEKLKLMKKRSSGKA